MVTITHRRHGAIALSAAVAAVGLTSALAGCSTTEDNASYRNGSWFAEGKYVAPSGPESIGIVITLVDNVVTEVKVIPHATQGNQGIFQSKFAGGIAAEIVGKDLDDLHVARVAGSTLTSGGFNAALASIKSEAVED